MAMGTEAPKKLEWRINMGDGTSEKLVPESGPFERAWMGLKGLVAELIFRTWNFLEKAWKMGVAEPRKVIHGLKVGLALAVVSIFYYMRPFYEGVGGNAMWAVMTVVVVFESTVGATLSKCINRAIGTFLAGSLGVGVDWVASQSGEKAEPIILGISVFLFASAATFSRFMPSVKARFDYGALIFILTFSLVSVSGYRVDELFDLAHQRLSTIIIGASLCIIISMLFYPIWAGDQLHNLIHCNLDKLADSLNGCVDVYFNGEIEGENGEDLRKKLEGYKCVLNSKATEDSMANFARWEPTHGTFNFRHPWKHYLKVGASMRSCAYCLEALNGCINPEIQAPEFLKKHLGSSCLTLSNHASNVLKELAITMKTMTQSSKTALSVAEMQFAVEELKNALKSLPSHLIASPSSTLQADGKLEPAKKPNTLPILGVLPLSTLASLLIKIATRIEDVVNAVNELARLADFEPATSKKSSQSQPSKKEHTTDQDHQATTQTPTKA